MSDEDYSKRHGTIKRGSLTPLAPYTPERQPLDDRDYWRGSHRRGGGRITGQKEQRGPRKSYRT